MGKCDLSFEDACIATKNCELQISHPIGLYSGCVRLCVCVYWCTNISACILHLDILFFAAL